MPARDNITLLTSSAARDCMPLQPAQPRRGSTSHASRRWRRGGPFTAARRRPRAAHRNDADRSCPRPCRHRSRPTRLLQASRSAAAACRRRRASNAAFLAAEPTLQRRSESLTSSSGNRARRGPKRLRIKKETTHRHDSRKRVASLASRRRGTAARRDTTGLLLADGTTKVGTVTSGTVSPCLNAPIAMGYVESGLGKNGTELTVRHPRLYHATRLQERSSWVVYFSFLSCFRARRGRVPRVLVKV